MRNSNERGIAMITTLLVLMLISALLVGFTTMVMSDQRFRFIDRDRGQAFYAASGAVEKLTADLGNTFFANVAPTATQVTNLVATTSLPVITGVTFTSANAPAILPGSSLNASNCTAPNSIWQVGALGYNLTYCGDATHNPTSIQPPSNIKTGPYEGLVALQTPYQIDVTAKTATGGEVHLTRTIESVAIPVFQFGTFSDVDLSFFAGSPFSFGGRVHTNGTLFLSEGGTTPGPCPNLASALTLAGKVTAVKEIVRQKLQNGVSIDVNPAHNGTVCMASSAVAFRPLDRTEGSVVDTFAPGAADPCKPTVTANCNDPLWHNTSLSSYNSWIRNGRTGAKVLNLPLLTVGGTNPDLIRRPSTMIVAPATALENVANPVLFNERLFTKASLRIMLSDTAANILYIPTVTSTLPISLGTTVADANWAVTPPAAGYAGPPIARSMGPIAATTTTASTTAGASTQISVNAVPLWFQKPLISVKAAGVYLSTFACDTWNETSLTQCHHPAALVAGSTLYFASPAGTATLGPGNMPGNANPSMTLKTAVATGLARVLDVSPGTTTAFAANTFWLNDVGGGGSGVSTLVTCTGLNLLVFTGCTGVPTTSNNATITSAYASSLNTGTIGGFIKIERQDTAGVWNDVTAEILKYGIAGPNLAGFICSDPTPNAILRLQRLRDNSVPATGNCPIAIANAATNSYEYWPNALFDAREALQREQAPASGDVIIGGVMYYIALDVANLTKWYAASTAPYNCGVACTGAASIKNNGGYTVYFSDRRNNRTTGTVSINGVSYPADAETGEYGWEDFVNTGGPTGGVPNNLLDTGEDVNGDGVQQLYGGTPSYNGAHGSVPPGAVAPLNAAATPITQVPNQGIAMVNRSIFFRHALKLINGSQITGLTVPSVTGLTIVAENPVYIQGDWNANNAAGAGFTAPSAGTAVIADALTLLSSNWSDANSFNNPYNAGARRRTSSVVDSWYRVAIIAGKGAAFPWINGTPTDFGTDGGAHNFLRYLEDSNDAAGLTGTVNYLGAQATFFYNRQAVGTYKYGSGIVYNAPTRAYNFDINFTNPALLPPNTPVFRDMNAVGFSQELRPGK